MPGLILAAIAYVIVNLPALRVHRLYDAETRRRLKGFAPNQFFFLTSIFPFAAFFLLYTLQQLLSNPQVTSPIGTVYWYLVPLCFIGFGVVIVYYELRDTLPGFDQLKPRYAQAALEAAKNFRRSVESLPVEEQAEKRGQLIEGGQKAMKDWLERKKESSPRKLVSDLEAFMKDGLEGERTEEARAIGSAFYLQVVCNRPLQGRLGLLLIDKWLRRLNAVELFTALLVGACGICSVALLILQKDKESFRQLAMFVVIGLLSFSVFPACFRYWVNEIRYLSERHHHMWADLAVIIMFVCLAGTLLWVFGGPTAQTAGLVLQLISVLSPVILYVLSSTPQRPRFLREIIGVDSNPGTKAVLVIVFTICFALMALTFLRS